jgi:hypothetical protein
MDLTWLQHRFRFRTRTAVCDDRAGRIPQLRVRLPDSSKLAIDVHSHDGRDSLFLLLLSLQVEVSARHGITPFLSKLTLADDYKNGRTSPRHRIKIHYNGAPPFDGPYALQIVGPGPSLCVADLAHRQAALPQLALELVNCTLYNAANPIGGHHDIAEMTFVNEGSI